MIYKLLILNFKFSFHTCDPWLTLDLDQQENLLKSTEATLLWHMKTFCNLSSTFLLWHQHRSQLQYQSPSYLHHLQYYNLLLIKTMRIRKRNINKTSNLYTHTWASIWADNNKSMTSSQLLTSSLLDEILLIAGPWFKKKLTTLI